MTLSGAGECTDSSLLRVVLAEPFQHTRRDADAVALRLQADQRHALSGFKIRQIRFPGRILNNFLHHVAVSILYMYMRRAQCTSEHQALPLFKMEPFDIND